MPLGFSNWKDTIWNEQGNSYVKIENGIADLFYNEKTGEWGASILFQGKYPHSGYRWRKLLVGETLENAEFQDCAIFLSKYPIERGKYWLEAKWKLVERKFNINPLIDDAKGNVGIEFIAQINDLNYDADYCNCVRIAIVFCGFKWNGSDFEEIKKGEYWIQKGGLYDRDFHITFFVDELREIGKWQATKVDLGYYINKVFELLKDEGVEKLSIRLIQLYVEGVGVALNAQFDYVRTILNK